MLTVKDIRRAIEGCPDDAEVILEWADGPPSDEYPGVEVKGFKGDGKNPTILVALFHLDEDEFETTRSDETGCGHYP